LRRHNLKYIFKYAYVKYIFILLTNSWLAVDFIPFRIYVLLYIFSWFVIRLKLDTLRLCATPQNAFDPQFVYSYSLSIDFLKMINLADFFFYLFIWQIWSMSSSYKPRSSDEALAEQFSLARAGSGTKPPATPTYRQISGAMATLPRHDNNHNHNDNSSRIFSQDIRCGCRRSRVTDICSFPFPPPVGAPPI